MSDFSVKIVEARDDSEDPFFVASWKFGACDGYGETINEAKINLMEKLTRQVKDRQDALVELESVNFGEARSSPSSTPTSRAKTSCSSTLRRGTVSAAADAAAGAAAVAAPVFVGHGMSMALSKCEMMASYKYFVLVSGVGYGETELTSFDDALLKSGIGDFNLVRMSSILPAGSVQLEIVENDNHMLEASNGIETSSFVKGSLVPIAYSSMSFKKEKVLIPRINPKNFFASVSVAVPYDQSLCGLIMEHHGFQTEDNDVNTVVAMAEEGMKNRSRAYTDIYRKHAIESSTNVCGKWATVFAGVLLMP